MSKPTLGPAPAAHADRAWGRSRRGLLAVAGTISGLLAIAAGASIAFLAYVEGLITRADVPGLEDVLPNGPMNVIVLGSDTREVLSEQEQEAQGTPEDVGGERSDTMILLQLDPRRQKAVLVHFPRDLRVEIPGYGADKINTAYTRGGPGLVVETVREFSGLPIHHYVEVNFVGFKNLVDALGGVEVCVDRPLFDELARLRIPRAGCSVFDGRRALAFVRARNVEGDAIPDFARISRQQQFIRALFNELLRVDSILQPGVIREAARNITTDADLSLTDILQIGRELQGLGSTAVDFRVIPATPEEIDGISYVVADEGRTERLFERLADGEPLGSLGSVQAGTAPSPATIRVRVLDAGGGERVRAVYARLLGAGFQGLGTRKAPGSLTASEILFRPGREDRADVVGGFFPALERRPAPRGLLGRADVAVVVDEAFRGGA